MGKPVDNSNKRIIGLIGLMLALTALLSWLFLVKKNIVIDNQSQQTITIDWMFSEAGPEPSDSDLEYAKGQRAIQIAAHSQGSVGNPFVFNRRDQLNISLDTNGQYFAVIEAHFTDRFFDTTITITEDLKILCDKQMLCLTRYAGE